MSDAVRHYYDWNAGAPASSEALLAASRALEVEGNPSSVHGFGRAVRARIEEARGAVAALVGASAEDLVFTSGGTEGLHLAMASALAEVDKAAVFASAVEHEAALAAARDQAAKAGAPFALTPVDGDGLVDVEALKSLIAAAAPRTPVLMVQTANNETGVIQNVKALARIVAKAGGLTVLDAVQTVGRAPFDMVETGADYAVASAHKMGGFAGTGAVVRACGRGWAAQITGGGQERYARAGTENLIGIAAFGAAAKAAASPKRLGAWAFAANARDRMEAALKNLVPGLIILGEGAARMPNVSCFAAPGFKAETAVIALDLEGYAISAGAACSSGKAAPSHVATAMGRPDIADQTVRVSFGPGAYEDDASAFALAFARIAGRARSAQRTTAKRAAMRAPAAQAA